MRPMLTSNLGLMDWNVDTLAPHSMVRARRTCPKQPSKGLEVAQARTESGD